MTTHARPKGDAAYPRLCGRLASERHELDEDRSLAFITHDRHLARVAMNAAFSEEIQVIAVTSIGHGEKNGRPEACALALASRRVGKWQAVHQKLTP